MAGMKSLKKTRRVQVIALAGVCVAAVLVILAMLPDESFQFFRSPTEVAEAPPPSNELFRIGGLIVEGSIVSDAGETVRFDVTDGNATIPVVYTGILPDLFGDGPRHLRHTTGRIGFILLTPIAEPVPNNGKGPCDGYSHSDCQ